MTINFCLKEVDRTEIYNIPELASNLTWSLWLTTSDEDNQSSYLSTFYNLCLPLKPIIWYSTTAKNKTNDLQPCLARMSTDYTLLKSRSVSIVDWLTPETLGSFTKSIQSTHENIYSIISFINSDYQVLIDWIRLIEGMHWLWLNGKFVADAPKPSLNASSVIASYVNITAMLNGVAGLSWRDSNLKQGFAFYGNIDFLRKMAFYLSANGHNNVDNLYSSINAKGYSFDLAG